MNRVPIVLIALMALSCETRNHKTPSERELDTLQAMPPPIVVVAKEKTLVGHCVILRGADGKFQNFGDLALGGRIGESYDVGDTLK